MNPSAGTGSRLSLTPFGYVYSGAARTQSFNHPWRPLLGRNEIQIGRGLVEFHEPKIGEVPIGGDDKHPAPSLKLDPKIATKEDESWVCVEVTPNDKGFIDNKSIIVIAHRSSPIYSAGNYGREAIVLILWKDGIARLAFPLVYFNLRYERSTPAPGQGPPRHFFK
jgi:hypothetical protein